MLTKLCSKCKREFQATNEYFYTDKRYNKLCSRCKECYGASFSTLIRVQKVLNSAKEGFKICTQCLRELPATDEYFCNSKKGLLGLGQQCKNCLHRKREENEETILQRKREYREKNREEIRRRQNELYNKNMEEVRKKAREYYAKNKTKIQQMNKKYKQKKVEWVKNNRDKINAQKREWRKNNRDKYLLEKHNRRAKEKQLESYFTNETWEECKKHFESKCAYCGKTEFLTQDHFIPVTNGGEYTKNNIIPSCQPCNSSKNNNNFFEWYPRQKFYSKHREKKILKYLHYDMFNNQIQQLAITI